MFFRFIQTARTGVKLRFGKYIKMCPPGLNFYIPFIEHINEVSNKVINKEFRIKVKTMDNAFADMHIGVQMRIKPVDSKTAFFSLDDPDGQLSTYVQNVVRGLVPSMTLDNLFQSTTEINDAVRNSLDGKMSGFGYTIIDTLVSDIRPAKNVVDAMNSINAAEKTKEAALAHADAEYIRQVRKAEGDRQRKILQGEGISGQRLAILNGYQSSVDNMSTAFGLSPKDVIDFVLKTQEFDMMETIGTSINTKTIFVGGDTSPVRKAVMEANQV